MASGLKGLCSSTTSEGWVGKLPWLASMELCYRRLDLNVVDSQWIAKYFMRLQCGIAQVCQDHSQSSYYCSSLPETFAVQEHLTSIQKVLGSIPSWVSFFFGISLLSQKACDLLKSLQCTSSDNWSLPTSSDIGHCSFIANHCCMTVLKCSQVSNGKKIT